MLSAERTRGLWEEFRRRTGREPTGIWFAPGRVNLIGEHTDYNDGLVLPFAIDRQALAAVRLRDDGELRPWTLQEQPEGWMAFPRGVLRALGDRGVSVPGADILIDSDVPDGAGLSSSAALACSIAVAVNELAAGGLDRMQLVSACQSAENTEVGAQTGIMDQVASLFGAEGSLVLLDVRDRSVTQVPAELPGLTFLVIDTQVTHRHSESGYADRRAECADAAALLGLASLRDAQLEQVADLAARPGREGLVGRRARHVFTENARVLRAVALLRAGRPRELGPLLLASHASLRDDFEVSAPEADVAVNTAHEAGALGARIVGGGFGGSVLALVPEDACDNVERTVRSAFARRDWARPDVFPVHPSAGARRLR